MDIDKIKEILPHRYPFLFVDKVIEITENKIVAVKNVCANEPFFVGHFPDFPLFPGVLLCEALAQTAGIFLLKDIPESERRNKLTLFLGLDKFRFKRMVRPGDVLTIECELRQRRENIFKFQGRVKVQEEIAGEGEILLGFKEKIG